jgi:tetratricopeptide (TPR) repeat protein
MTRPVRTATALLALLLFLPGLALAGPEDEAARQVQLARSDIEDGHYERAISACDSALRLDATAQEAFKLKGLALEQLGQIDDARGMLLAYKSLRSGLPDDPEVEAALARMKRPAAVPVVVESRQAPRPRPEPPPRRERQPPPKDVVIALVVTLVGGGVSAGGFAAHGLSYREAEPHLYDGGRVYVGNSADYATLHELNERGFQIGVGGAIVAGIGLTLAIVGGVKRAQRVERHAGPLPWVAAGPEGGMVGLAGELP